MDYNIFKQKYIKYKTKYCELKGGANSLTANNINLIMNYQRQFEDELFRPTSKMNCDNFTSIQELKKLFKFYIYYKNSWKEFKFKKLLYQSDKDASLIMTYEADDNTTIVLKIKNNHSIPIETTISETLLASDCNTIKEKYLGMITITTPSVSTYHCYIMNYLHGTLYDKIPVINQQMVINTPETIQLKLQIAEEVRKQFLCIFNMNNEYIYTDSKLENILYGGCIESSPSISIHLADLESAIKFNGKYLATYPPPEKNDNTGWFTINNGEEDQILSWGLGIILYSLIDVNITELDKLLYSTTQKITTHELNSIREQMNRYYGSRLPNAGNYLSPTPEERQSISTNIVINQ